MTLFSFLTVTVTFVAAIAPPIQIPGQQKGEEGRFPAPPGYLLPWVGGEIQGVTQGEETTFTHNGSTAYAYDFDLTYETVVAARSGKVTMVREDSNSGGCDPKFSTAANYVVIDHGDGTSSLYLHLAQNGVQVAPGDIVAQGDPIAVSGATGLTCADEGSTEPGPHLHFQVQRSEENRPLTQSLPVAFDDINTNSGVPQEGRSYVSGNFGEGQAQKIKLTPWRVPRAFNPTARPADPKLVDGPPLPTPTPAPFAEQRVDPASAATPTPAPTEPPTRTPVPDDTNTPEPDDASTPAPANTEPPPTGTPAPPTATLTPAPSPTATAPPVVDTPVPPTEEATTAAATVEPPLESPPPGP